MSPTPTTSRRLSSSPTQNPWPTHSSPSKGSSRTWSTMTPHSRICFTKHTEYMSITLSEKACLSVSRRRPCPSEPGDPLESEQGDLLDQVVRSWMLQMHRLEFVLRIWLINFKDTFKTGESLLNIFFQLVFITYSKWYKNSRTRGSNWEWHLSSNCVNYGCLSVCRRRQYPTERGDPLSTETRKHRLGLCSTNKKSKFLQSAKQELTYTNFKPLTTEEAY